MPHNCLAASGGQVPSGLTIVPARTHPHLGEALRTSRRSGSRPWTPTRLLPMELLLLVLGAVLGVTVDKAYEWARRHQEGRRRALHYKVLNEKNVQVQALHPNLLLVQAGWDPSGFFAPGSISLRVDGSPHRSRSRDLSKRIELSGSPVVPRTTRRLACAHFGWIASQTILLMSERGQPSTAVAWAYVNTLSSWPRTDSCLMGNSRSVT